jgi:hypothetical protein
MEKETLKSLRAKAKELRSKVSSAPLSKATPDQLRSEIVMLERAVKAEEKAKEKKALKEASKLPEISNNGRKSTVGEKKKIMSPPAKAVTATKVVQKKDSDGEREKALLKREKELAKKEKLLSYKMMEKETEDTSDSDDY